MVISDRTREIIEYLLEVGDYVTVSEMAKILKVTNRTIYRQISEVNEVVGIYEMYLDNIPKQGMKIQGSVSQIENLRKVFEEKGSEQVYSGTDRVNLIILNILFENDYIKTQSLAIDLNTSVQTIRNDYDKVKEALESHHISFLTKKGGGVKIEGEERNKRHLCTSILLQNITPNSMFNWLKGKPGKSNPYMNILKEWGYEGVLLNLYHHMEQVIQDNKVVISDREFQEFLLLLTIFVQRHDCSDSEKNSLKIHVNVAEPTHEIYKDIKHFLREDYQIELYENEKNYFYWLTNLYVSRTDDQDRNETSSLLLLDLISQLINLVGSRAHFPFEEDENLAKNLILHMKMALGRVGSGIALTNPLGDEIYRINPALYEIVEKSLKEIFVNEKISKDEIGYIVIYFITSMEFLKKASISVLVICTSGIGSSKMLRSRLEREFSEIQVTKILALHKLGNEDLSQYDMVISTTPLDLTEKEYLCVSPLLTEKEIEEVRKRINSFTGKEEKNESNF